MGASTSHTMEADLDSRINAYADAYSKLKENNASPEILEREMLTRFLHINLDRFSDLSPTPLQQLAVINLICLRAFKYERYKYVQNIIQGFIGDITRFTGLEMGDNFDEEDEEDFLERKNMAKQNLRNTELLLFKLIQSVVRVQAVILNSFEEIIHEVFSEKGVALYKGIYDKLEFSSNFWRSVIETFIKQEVTKAYNRIVTKAKYSYARSKKSISINFSFDYVLDEIRKDELLQRKKKKHAFYIETDVQEFELKRIRQVVYDFLKENMDIFLLDNSSQNDLNHIIQIVCFDQAAADYKRLAIDEVLHTMQWEDMQRQCKIKLSCEDDLEHVKEELLACALGAAMAYDTIKKDFINAINVFSTKNMQIFSQEDIEHVQELVTYFEPETLNLAFRYMIEHYFYNLLKRKSMDKKDKVEIRASYKRRVGKDALEELFQWGLTRIQKNKIFKNDTTRAEMFEFRCVDYETLEKLYDILQMENYQREKMDDVWLNAERKVEFYVIIRLDLLTKTTTDIKRGISEILYKYGIMVA